MSVFEKIEAQQKGKEQTAPWMVGEQLKEILRGDEAAQALVDKDLDDKAHSLDACERQIKAWADGHKHGDCAVVPPDVAEGIIRKFYGLPERGERGTSGTPSPTAQESAIRDIADFL